MYVSSLTLAVLRQVISVSLRLARILALNSIGRMRNVLRPVSLALDAPSMFGNLAFGIWQVKTRNKRKNEEEEETFLLLLLLFTTPINTNTPL